GCQSEQRHAGATLAKSAVVCDERLLERRACVSLRQLRERRRVAVVAQRNAGLLELTGPEQRGARSPSCTVAWSRVGPELGTERDQLGQVGNSLDAADVRDPDEPVRVEVVAEQQRRVFVDGLEEARPPVVHEVALVDRLESERVALVAEHRENGLVLGLRAHGVVPEWALTLRLECDRLPEINRRSLQPPAPSSRSRRRRVQWR